MRLSTGIEQLDRKFSEIGDPDAGLPPGSIVTVQSPPEAQCDSLIAAGIDQRETVYVTTVRSERAIRESLDRVAEEPDIGRVIDVDHRDAMDRIMAELADLDQRQDLIIEVVDVLEETAEPEEYVAFLDRLSARLHDVDSIALLHGLSGDGETPTNRRYTLEASHFVWDLQSVSDHRNRQLQYFLSIPKARGFELAEDDRMLEVDVGQDFYIDETRNI